jgi:hypothetical protein
MLWYKGWLETRFRLLFVLAFSGFILVRVSSTRVPAPGVGKAAAAALAIFSNPVWVIIAIQICAMLGGAGVVTQPSFQASKGLHGSTQFTLSLPVSRLRLMAIRASVGWLEVITIFALLCCGIWQMIPQLRALATPLEMFEYAGTLIACTSAVYFLSVLLATFLDDQWRVWGTLIASGGLWWLSSHTWFPEFANIFLAIGKGSPLIAHTMPWAAMAFSVSLATIFFFAALKVAQTREY